ncbi:M23 family metallopeptidase [Priestia megaterium]|uniref:M23 family metallopeptidase n=1 Tax=Priestia megaterium TaxID=1404 RepID=UPI0030F3FDA4
MPYQYQRTPFDTTQQVRMYQGCHGFSSGAKDIGFYGMQWGEPVYAVEAGTVVYIKSDSDCFSQITSPTSAIPAQCLTSNNIVVRSNDGFFTDYVHVLPNSNLRVGSTIQVGTLLGKVDNSAQTSGPHVHLVRYKPKSDYNPGAPDYWLNGGTCNWTMFNVAGITPSPISNGWVQDEDSGRWYYYVNGVRQTNQWVQTGNTYYELDSTGAWTGSYYYFDTNAQRWYWWNNSAQKWYYWDGTRWLELV